MPRFSRGELSALVLAFGILQTSPSEASTVSFDYTGTITACSLCDNILGADLELADAFSGRFFYDTDAFLTGGFPVQTNQLAVRWDVGVTGATFVHDPSGAFVDNSAAPPARAIGIMTNDRFSNPLGPDGFEFSQAMFPRLDGQPLLGGRFEIELSISRTTFPASPPNDVPETLAFLGPQVAGNSLVLTRQIETSPGHFAIAFLTGRITSVVPSPVPEPGSLVHVAVGLAVLSFLYRRTGV
jgi:hypothetical protein